MLFEVSNYRQINTTHGDVASASSTANGVKSPSERLDHRSLNQLRLVLEREGLFEVSSRRLILEPLVCILAFVWCYFAYPQFPLLALAVQIVACIHMVWWIHDAGHHSFFKSETFSKFSCEVLGQIFLGMPQVEYHFEIHRQHHRQANLIHKDPALQTGPVTWHAVQREREPQWMARVRPMIWLLIVLPLTWPIMTLNCTRLLFVNRKYLRLMLTLGRWCLFGIVFFDRLPLLLIPPLVAGFVLGLSASLNHFHMPIWTTQASWLSRVFLSTQNVCPENRFLGWLMGGLNCHVEHHLFPRMPSHHLARASIHVKSFATQLNLPYQSQGLCASLQALFNKLRESEIHELKERGVR
ncbi:MAG: hypothetical protein RL189_1597 [Pseudomonadota bacterium]|jgi:fatty acid desaturase